MDSIRQNKVARLIQKELSEIFLFEGKNLFPGVMVSVTVVRVSPDMGVAKVYLSLFTPARNNKEVFGIINDNVKVFRHRLSQRIKYQMRSTPELIFYEDDSLDYMENIDKLLGSKK